MARPQRQFNDFPFSRFQELKLSIDSLTNQGSGVARVDIKDKKGEVRRWVVFVPFSIPGETILCRILRNDKNCSHAEIISILDSSNERVEPVCQVFGTCGGCQYQHISYKLQLEWKTHQTQELLTRMAGIDLTVDFCVASPMQWNYRSKITPHFDRPKKGKIKAIGFQPVGRMREIVDIEQCPIAQNAINDALPIIKKTIRAKGNSFKEDTTLLLRVNNDQVETNASTAIIEQVGDLTFHFLAGDFFQTNPSILPSFTEYVAELARGNGCRYLVDTYCGSGLFALSLAKHFEAVQGIEIVETAADWARYNAKKNNITNATFTAGSAERIFAQTEFPADETTVVIDPPRKGCDQLFLEQLFDYAPNKVVYISCNPATQMRDLKCFTKHGYKLKSVRPFDLFPQTKHLECVMLLETD